MFQVISLIVFFIEFIIAYRYVQSSLSLVMGCFIMLFVSISTFISVKIFLNEGHPLLGPSILLAKVPITLLSIYIIFRSPSFEIYSFFVGLLIVLPCLVIVSYRKS